MGFLSGKQLNYSLTTKSLVTMNTYAVPAELGVWKELVFLCNRGGKHELYFDPTLEHLQYIFSRSLNNKDHFPVVMHLSSSSLTGGGGGPRAVGGGIGDFVGILQHICAPVVGEMKGF